MNVRSQRCWTRFKQQVSGQNGEVLELEWLGKDKPHRCRCVKGHECSPRPGDVRDGHGICRACAARENPVIVQRKAAGQSNFYRGVAAQFGEVLEPKYLGNHKPHRCRCSEGHECWPHPSSVQQGRGICRVCAGNDPAAAWVQFQRLVSGQAGEVLEPEWLGKDKPHRCRCANGHECSPRPGDVRGGHGICLACSWAAQDVLYLVRNPMTGWVKFGISNRDGRSRLRNHRGTGFTEVLRLEVGLSKGLALHTEQKIKLALAMVDAKPARGREYFSDEYLPLIENEISNWIPADQQFPDAS